LRFERDIVTQWWKRAGDIVFLLGAHPAHGSIVGLAGSEYAAWKQKDAGSLAPNELGLPPRIDLALEARLQRLVLGLARAHRLESAHDVSEGGLALALAECATTSPSPRDDIGARIDLEAPAGAASEGRLASLLFGEHPSRILVSVRPDAASSVRADAEASQVPWSELGVTGGDSLSIAVVNAHPDREGRTISAKAVLSVSEIRLAREACLASIVGE
jgi:phosphoribosylformylglycinamidine synthase